jgi:adenylylsulfate kinase-like enzyme
VQAHGAEGVLLTGVYGSGKSPVAAELAYLLEHRGEPYALLDLDYLSWAGTTCMMRHHRSWQARELATAAQTHLGELVAEAWQSQP